MQATTDDVEQEGGERHHCFFFSLFYYYFLNFLRHHRFLRTLKLEFTSNTLSDSHGPTTG